MAGLSPVPLCGEGGTATRKVRHPAILPILLLLGRFGYDGSVSLNDRLAGQPLRFRATLPFIPFHRRKKKKTGTK